MPLKALFGLPVLHVVVGRDSGAAYMREPAASARERGDPQPSTMVGTFTAA